MDINQNREWRQGATAVAYRLHNIFRNTGHIELAIGLEDLSSAYLMNDSVAMRKAYRKIQDAVEKNE